MPVYCSRALLSPSSRLMPRARVRLGLAVSALLVIGLIGGFARHRPRWIATEELGPVRAFPAWFGQRGFSYLFSGAGGWSATDEQIALEHARHGEFVAGIDTPRWLQYLNRTEQGCIYLPAVLENYSHAQQRRAGTATFDEPTLLGEGIGGAIVYMAQLQAPVLAFAAAVALDPDPQLPLRPPFCDHAAAARDAHGQRLAAERAGSTVPLRLVLDGAAGPEARALVLASAPAAHAGLSLMNLPLAAPAEQYRRALDSIAMERGRSGLADLPLVEVEAAAPQAGAFAVLYSGDGGWRDLDRSLADVLASKGMDVVGVDVLRYYWRRRSPAAAARDLTRVIHYYQQHWQHRPVVLIGFSFGADVLPFIVNHLPRDVRADVRLLTLLSPERTTAFEVEPAGWFHLPPRAGEPIEPQLRPLASLRVQCIYGEDEADTSLCTTAAAGAHQVLRKRGGHHFDENYAGLADDILAAAARTAPHAH